MQHPRAIGGGMDDNTKASASNAENTPSSFINQRDLTARYRWIYDDLCRYCNEMWANIASIRIRAVEHVIFSASLLGLHLAFTAASEYMIRWWGLSSILLLAAVTIPHLLLMVNLVKTDEFYLRTLHSHSPAGEPERMIVARLEEKAEFLNTFAQERGRKYTKAKNYWFIGIVVCCALAVIEWFL